MIRSPWEIIFARNIYAGSLLEAFMVTAVTSVLAIRFFLEITGYPQVGGGGLHIAMYWSEVFYVGLNTDSPDLPG